MNDVLGHLNKLALPWRLAAFAGLAVVTHLVVIYQELIAEIKQIIPDYQPWMVSISYEVEKCVALIAAAFLLLTYFGYAFLQISS